MSRPAATVSVDLDPVDLHLQGYGFRGLPPDPLVYTVALPRLLEIFERCRIAATFFIVGRDALAQAGPLAQALRAGHEIASHSLTHPMAFTSLAPEAMRGELVESRRMLEQACGGEVTGYRSPNFDMSPRGIEALAASGYRYDASGYPTLMLIPARLLLAWKSRDAVGVMKLRAWPVSWRRGPHALGAGASRIEEFPVSVTPGVRFPVYHTARYVLGHERFVHMLDGFARRGEPLSYPLHAVDALGLEEDRVDARLAPHPGMNLALREKLDLLERSLQAIAQRFDSAPFRARLGAV